MRSIIYIADPMCSWCYGASPAISQLKEHFADSFNFRLVLGGLRPGGGDAWDEKFRDMLRHHWEQVGKATHQPFNFDLLDWESFNYDTEPPSRAVRVVRDLAPAQEFEFFKAVQQRFYKDNQDPAELAFYQPICEALGISFAEFSSRFETPKYRNLTRADFLQSANWGIKGFPSVVLDLGDKMGLLSHGYLPFEKMKERMEELAGVSQ